MSFTKQELAKFAKLIRIEIPDDELTAMNVDQVFDWLDEMKQIDTAGALPMFSPAGHPAPLRTDAVTVQNIRDEILANAPDTAGKSAGYFAVPKVMDE